MQSKPRKEGLPPQGGMHSSKDWWQLHAAASQNKRPLRAETSSDVHANAQTKCLLTVRIECDHEPREPSWLWDPTMVSDTLVRCICKELYGHESNQCIRSQPALYQKLSAGMAREKHAKLKASQATRITKPSKNHAGQDWRIQCYPFPKSSLAVAWAFTTAGNQLCMRNGAKSLQKHSGLCPAQRLWWCQAGLEAESCNHCSWWHLAHPKNAQAWSFKSKQPGMQVKVVNS